MRLDFLASANGTGGRVYCTALAASTLNGVNGELRCPLCCPSCLGLTVEEGGGGRGGEAEGGFKKGWVRASSRGLTISKNRLNRLPC